MKQTKKSGDSMRRGTSFIFALIAISMLALAACTSIAPDGNLQTSSSSSSGTGASQNNAVPVMTFSDTGEVKEASQEMIKFKDINEVRKFLMERAASGQSMSNSLRSFGAVMKGGVAPMMETVAMADSAGTTESSAAYDEGASDYSQTNVQYANVDEGDFVKNDDRYIYIISDNSLVIVDAYDAKNAEIVSTTNIWSKPQPTSSGENDVVSSGKLAEPTASDTVVSSKMAIMPPIYYQPQETARELFVDGNKLILITESSEQTYYFPKYDVRPQPSYRQITNVYLFDITDRKNPELIKQFSTTGSYYQSRMIDGIAYIVAQEGVNYGPILYGPMVREGATMIQPDIYYFDNPEENYNFNTIMSVDLANEKVIDSKTFMLGYANTLMVSDKNIYIAYQKQRYWWGWYGQQYDKERFYDVVLPLLPASLKSDVNEIVAKGLDDNEEWQQIAVKLGEYFARIESDDAFAESQAAYLEQISDALDEYDTKKTMEDRKTIVHKIAIDNGMIEYKAKGEVDGSLLNQFSLDENEGYLRLATTVDVWTSKSIQYNNVYVLDDQMEIVGELTGVAKDERIYSTRFIGDKLYMVTFRQVDPFFVIDLADPTNPEVLGALKIPGFSNYLHPYDENHIIGVGKETKESEFGGVTTGGIKIALFDVTDFSDPQLVDQVVIGDQGSDSPALYDHKAFLFSKSKDLLVLPITEITRREKLDQWRYSNTVWHGAYVFKVTTDGFTEMGKVTHSSTKSDYWDWWNAASVMRSLYMDDNLYTISNKYIKINDLANSLEELNTVKLPYTENSPYYWR